MRTSFRKAYGERCTAISVRRTPYPVLQTPAFLIVLLLSVFFSPKLHAATGEKAMVVTPDPRATQVALEILQQGGNAVDAAVAAQWVLSVVEPQASGIGGGGLFLFYDIGTKRILFFDGSVKAPAKASPKMFLDPVSRRLLPYQPERNTGGLSVGVPGLLKLTAEVQAKYGTHKFTFAQLFEPAISYAENGAEVSASLAEAFREHTARLDLANPKKPAFSGWGASLAEGGKFFQPELAKTYRLIQKKGSSVFYEGAIAGDIARAVRKNAYRPGLLSASDLKHYAIAERDPLHAAYQGYDLFSAGPPADGGAMLFRALNILSRFGISGFGQTPETYHLLAETQRLALSNRTGVADPDLFVVPIEELLSEAWAQDRSETIHFDKVLGSQGTSWKNAELGEKRSGSSVMITDAHGNIAVLSATLGDAFGSALSVPDRGFFLNDLLADLAADPGAIKNPLSAEFISGGQRPRGPEGPVLFFKQGKPSVILNAYGADDPAAVLLNVMIQKFDLGTSCGGALQAPRLWVRDGVVLLEPGLYDPGSVRSKLELLGHATRKEERVGSAQMICFDEGSSKLTGESDPRAAGEAAGF